MSTADASLAAHEDRPGHRFTPQGAASSTFMAITVAGPLVHKASEPPQNLQRVVRVPRPERRLQIAAAGYALRR